MGTHTRLALILLALGASCRDHRPPLFVGGIQVNEPLLDRWISTVEAAGLDTVSVTVYAKQGDWNSSRLWSDAEVGPVRAEIAAAHRAGLRVVLILRVALDHAFEANRFLWHGMIAPAESELSAWFDNYGDFVRRWARVAEQEGVEVFGLGSELNRLTATRPVADLPPLEAWYLDAQAQAKFRALVLAQGERITRAHRAALGGGHFPSTEAFLDARSDRWKAWAEQVAYLSNPKPTERLNARRNELERHWRSLIRSVRGIYQGRLTYAANFDHYREVTFWDALDVVGINAYFTLRREPSTLAPSPAELSLAWNSVFTEIGRFRTQENLTQPVLFTELGYTRRRNSTVHPWAQSGFAAFGNQLLIYEDEPLAPEERARALTALRQVALCGAKDWFAGLLYWKLSSWPDQQAVESFAVVLGTGDPAETALSSFSRLKLDCDQAGSQSSTLFPSGSMIHAKRPLNSSSGPLTGLMPAAAN